MMFFRGDLFGTGLIRGFIKPHEDGKKYFAYGGDFGEDKNDGNFCMNGIVRSNRVPTAKTAEVKKVYQNISFDDWELQNQLINFRNKFFFTNLDEFDFKWELIENGLLLQSGNYS